MSQTIHRAHQAPHFQSITARVPAGEEEEKVSDIGTFDLVCHDEGCGSEDCQICCVGCIAPYCLLGSAVKMRRQKGNNELGPCAGSGGACAGFFFLGCVLGSFGYVGSMINGFIAMQCLNTHDKGGCCASVVQWASLSFCLPCESCAAYKRVLVTKRRRKTQMVSRGKNEFA